MLKTILVRVIKIAAFYGGGVTGIAFLFVFGGEVISWLKTGVWTHVPIVDPDRIQMEWLGVQKIAHWFADLPLALLLFSFDRCLLSAISLGGK